MWTPKMLWVSVAILFSLVIHVRAGNCMEQQHMPGFMVPQGDIIVEYGKPLEIWCVLDPEHNATLGYNASNIRFTYDRNTVPAEYVQVVNATAARLYMEHAEPLMNTNFFCKLKTKATRPIMVCLNHVVIGYPPSKLKVENFSCISQHLRNINCTWNIVPENTVRTHYSISYAIGPEETRYLNRFTCPDKKSPDFGYCYWDDITKPNYREKHEMYYFTITAENALGQEIFDDIEFNQWAHAVLEKPDYLNGSDITTNSVVLHWRIDPHLKPLSLKYRLQYKSEASECDPEGHWKVVNTSDFGWKTTSYNMTNLPYANFLYDVRLSVAPSSAEGDDMWSKPATYTFRTKPRPPDSPPSLAPGSFQVAGKESSRDVFIFWQRLPRCKENGEEFQYKVVAKALDGPQTDINANVSKSSFAKFSNLSLDAYEISVLASNKEGVSQRAVIEVPEKKQMPPPPSQISEYILDGGAVQLRWDNPYSSEWADQIESFTVFWCLNEQYSSSHCSGLLNYEVMDKTASNKTIITDPGKVYAFGVAANTKTSSSGISWVSCVIRPGNNFGKVSRPSVLRTESTFVEVSFFVDCVDTLRLAHYDVYYCPIHKPMNPECREPEKALTVKSSSKEVKVNVTGLRPYTTYRLSVVPVDARGQPASDRSSSVNTTTLEGSPTPPRDVVVCDVTGESARVSWKPPAAANGLLRGYEVVYEGGQLRVPFDRNETRLEGLAGYQHYSVVVKACARGCTAAPPVPLHTKIGHPVALDRPTPRLLDVASLGLRWKAPKIPGGPAPIYQALVEATDGENVTTILHPPTPEDLSDTIHFQGCESNPDATYRVYVRAVNVEGNRTFFGEWSSPAEVDCNVGIAGVSTKHVVLWCVGTLTVIVVGALLVLGLGRLARWWRLARGVQVKLPPGLAPAPVTEPLDKAERASERLVRTPWILYGARGPPAPDSPTHEETTLLRAARHGGGGSESSAGSDGALSSLASATTTAASDSDGDHDHDQPQDSSSKPRAVRQWSTFSDGSVSRSTPNLWEAEHAPAYCRAGLGPAQGPASGYVAVACAPYVRRGSLDGWPPPTGYTQICAINNNELVCATELKAKPVTAGYVPRPEATQPPPTKGDLLRGLSDNWMASPQAVATGKAAPSTVARTQPPRPQAVPTVWPTIRCEVPPPAALPSPAAARGYVTVDSLPSPSQPAAPAGYVVCSAAPSAPGRPPDGYVTASPPPDGYVAASPPPPASKTAAGPSYVAMGDVASSPVHRPSVARGYVTLQELGQS